MGVARLLLEKGADPNCVDRNGSTPLSYAIGKRHSNLIEMVQVLLDYGADLDYKRKDRTIRDTIRMFQDSELERFVE